MKKWLKRVLVIVLLAVFLFSAGTVLVVSRQYAESREGYEEATAAFTRPNSAASASGGAGAAGGSASESGSTEAPESGTEAAPGGEAASAPARELPPLQVDFAALRAVNEDVVGWLYCEGTAISYPLVRGADNDYYLHRSYDRSRNAAGSIFMEELNSPDFSDGNTILYGHNMRDGSMFAALQSWLEPSFYEAHPVLWLLTPEQDYRVEVMAAYTTSADSETYTIYSAPCPELDGYAQAAIGRSAFRPAVQPAPGARWVLLSTCAYIFDSARYVLHGMLCPVDSVGGVPRA